MQMGEDMFTLVPRSSNHTVGDASDHWASNQVRRVPTSDPRARIQRDFGLVEKAFDVHELRHGKPRSLMAVAGRISVPIVRVNRA